MLVMIPLVNDKLHEMRRTWYLKDLLVMFSVSDGVKLKWLLPQVYHTCWSHLHQDKSINFMRRDG